MGGLRTEKWSNNHLWFRLWGIYLRPCAPQKHLLCWGCKEVRYRDVLALQNSRIYRNQMRIYRYPRGAYRKGFRRLRCKHSTAVGTQTGKQVQRRFLSRSVRRSSRVHSRGSEADPRGDWLLQKKRKAHGRYAHRAWHKVHGRNKFSLYLAQVPQ